jgi:hypothetical protein
VAMSGTGRRRRRGTGRRSVHPWVATLADWSAAMSGTGAGGPVGGDVGDWSAATFHRRRTGRPPGWRRCGLVGGDVGDQETGRWRCRGLVGGDVRDWSRDWSVHPCGDVGGPVGGDVAGWSEDWSVAMSGGLVGGDVGGLVGGLVGPSAATLADWSAAMSGFVGGLVGGDVGGPSAATPGTGRRTGRSTRGCADAGGPGRCDVGGTGQNGGDVGDWSAATSTGRSDWSVSNSRGGRRWRTGR